MRKISFVKIEAFEVCFLGLQWESFLRSYFIQLITFTALEKCEKEFNMLEIILVQSVCPLKIKLLNFLMNFVLIVTDYGQPSISWKTMHIPMGCSNMCIGGGPMPLSSKRM